MKQLKVYRSSAGSGKTFTLVKHYLTILLKSESPYAFKEVLAITFTNKAAQEMKDRILYELQLMIYDPGSSDMLPLISKDTSIQVESLKLKCKSIFSKIIHNYSDFNVMTIDRFTNTIINAFSKELDLLPSYDIVLDEKVFLSDAISQFIDESSADEKFLQLVYSIIDDAIKQGLKTNIEKQLNQLEKILILNQQKIKHYDQNFLQNIRTSLSKKMNDLHNEIIIQINLLSQFILKYHILENWSPYNRLSKLIKLKENIVEVDIEFILQYYSWIDDHKLFKKSLSKTDQASVNTFLNDAGPCIYEILDNLKVYVKYRELTKLFVPFLMVNSLYSKLKELKTEQNVILISDFNTLISDIINNEPAGFIFERIGSRFNHVLVDEFQDTSVLQWHNLVPLIHESISNGGENLIVGDAKQAIYRWREGDAQQFMDLPKLPSLENRIEYETLFEYGFEPGYLETNWRSTSTVIKFNNTIFNEVSTLFDIDNIKEVFYRSKQITYRKDIGSVDVNFNDIALKDYLESSIKSIIDVGYSFSDITILIRSSKDGLEIANALNRLDIPYVSEDSIYLFYSVQFKLLFYGLSYFESRNNDDLKLLLHHLCVLNGEIASNSESILNIDFDHYISLRDYHKLEFILSILNLSKKDAFIDCFNDQFFQLVVSKKYSIHRFLEFIWDESKKISVDNNNNNAIQILTIHKSKGLEFPVVILPIGNWSSKTNLYQPFIWVDGVTVGQNEFDYFIAKMNKKLLTALDMENLYKKEEQLNILDDLNLYYVAFTRAVDHLFINFSGKSKKGEVSDILKNSIKRNENFNENEKRFFDGRLEKYEKKIKSKLKKPFVLDDGVNSEFQINYSLANEKNLNFGSVFHQIMSKVGTNFTDGFNFALELKEQYKITHTDYEKCCAYLEVLRKSKNLSFVFEEYDILYTEKEIVSSKGEIMRIDRMFYDQNYWWIIDYKTAKKTPSDIDQIETYMSVLKEIGYQKIKGMLIYLPHLEVIHV